MAIKHLVLNPETGKPELKTFKSEQAYRDYRQRPEQKRWALDIDLKVRAESANKKLRQLERKGLTNAPAYKQAQHQIHLITGDTTATRFPTAAKDTATVQRAVQAAYKFSKYDTATPGGFAKIQKRARKGFDKKFGKQAAKLSQKQYDIITAMADVLRDMFGALVPGSVQMFNTLIDIEDNTQFDDDDLRDFALDLQNEIDNAPDIVQEYTRHLISQGIDLFAHGIRPDPAQLVQEVINREQARLDSMQNKLKPKNNFPYK